MARFRDVDMQPKFIPVDFSRQILSGTFEHALNVLVDDELDLSPFAAELHNDEKGAPADDISRLVDNQHGGRECGYLGSVVSGPASSKVYLCGVVI